MCFEWMGWDRKEWNRVGMGLVLDWIASFSTLFWSCQSKRSGCGVVY